MLAGDRGAVAVGRVDGRAHGGQGVGAHGVGAQSGRAHGLASDQGVDLLGARRTGGVGHRVVVAQNGQHRVGQGLDLGHAVDLCAALAVDHVAEHGGLRRVGHAVDTHGAVDLGGGVAGVVVVHPVGQRHDGAVSVDQRLHARCGGHLGRADVGVGQRAVDHGHGGLAHAA